MRIVYGICSLALLKAFPAGAATTATIGLRGVVLAQAAVRLATASAPPRFVELGTRPGAPVVLRFTGLTNSAGGVIVSLTKGNTESAPAMLHAGDGSTVPYVVKIGDRPVNLAGGEALLAAVSRETASEDGQVLEIVPGSPVPAGKRFEDHLVLTIRAR